MSDTYYRAETEGAHVAEVAKGEAGKVAGEAGRQTRNLMDQARSEANDQAAQQQERVASGLHRSATSCRVWATMPRREWRAILSARRRSAPVPSPNG